jgi:sugar-specific transcriptional regulator TrmB
MPKGWNSLSLRQMHQALVELGLTKTDAEVYTFLAKKAPQNATDIAEALGISKHRFYTCLRKLQNKCIIKNHSERPKLFYAVPIEEALAAFVNANLEKAQQMEKNKGKILSFWQSIMKENKSSL